MLIIRKCPIFGGEKRKEIDVTEEQLKLWQEGTLIEDAMPNLTHSEREFIKTGLTDEAWEQLGYNS
tara:strand:+ start:1831 stop:2028 length:198 start_codon:yes stop_codon:yes gene_type:complete